MKETSYLKQVLNFVWIIQPLIGSLFREGASPCACKHSSTSSKKNVWKPFQYHVLSRNKKINWKPSSGRSQKMKYYKRLICKQFAQFGKCQRGEFVYVLWNVPIQIFAIFFHNFRGLKWIPQKKRMAPKFKTTTLAHLRLSLLLNNHNMAWSFVGKYEQVSTYVSWKIPL